MLEGGVVNARFALVLAVAVGLAACTSSFGPPAPIASPPPPRLTTGRPQLIFVGNLGNNTITEYAYPGGALVRTISQGVNQPRALAVDYLGNLYSGNFGSNNITVYGSAGNLIRTITQGVTGPYGLNASRDGMIYSANYASVTGYVVGETSPHVTITDGVAGATSVASGGGIVYAANTTANTVTEYETGSTTVLQTIVTPSAPMSVAAISPGYVVVSTCGCGGASGGAFIYWQEGAWPGQVSPPIPLSGSGVPTGPVAIGPVGNGSTWWVYVASADRTNAYRWQAGSGNAGLPLRLPTTAVTAMATDAYGDLAAVDAGGAVTVYTIADLAGHWTATTISNGIDQPAAIAATPF